MAKLGGYVIHDRGMVDMKGKGQVQTFWLDSHTTGQMHRRESANDDTLQLPNFIYSNNDLTKKRSPMVNVLPRKGSLIGFKPFKHEGSLINMPNFLRPKVHDSLLSIRTNSPKLSKKFLPLRQSKMLLRDQMIDRDDINHTNDLQIHSKIPKTSSSIFIKSTDRLNTLNQNNSNFDPTNRSHVKNESLTPLLSDDNHNGIDLTSIQNNYLIDFSHNCVDPANSKPLSGSKPKLSSQVSVKKWNSCTELDYDKVPNNRSTDDKYNKSHNNAINSNIDDQKMDETAKDWSKISIVDEKSIILNDSAKEKSYQVDQVKLHPGNCEFVIKSLNECDLKVESSV